MRKIKNLQSVAVKGAKVVAVRLQSGC
jgi:hypothetical protein